MAEFILLLHENPQSFKGLSAAEMQAIVARYTAWTHKIAAAGHLVSGQKLRDEGGVHLRGGRSGVVASSGPYAEASDIVSGFFIVKAASYADAEAVIADCPHFDFGWIELREIDPMEG
jgi:hypothetical protein